MNYGEIKPCSIENGVGVRVSLFVSGCRHHCKGCFNEETWDFGYGLPYTEETEQKIMEELAPPYIKGLTLLGGDPGEPENQEALLQLLRRIKTELKGKTVWTYTGYLYEDFLPGGKAYCDATEEYLKLIDVMVDGPFILDRKDISLRFKGSDNQRIININKTRENGSVVLEME
jgi:anaerobic ribonucleoside-triphosphate reductase activating protein